MENLKFFQCLKGEILAPEGVESDKIYMVVKGKLRVYRKLINDEVRDSNSRRQDMRLINQGQKIMGPIAQDKRKSLPNYGPPREEKVKRV